MPSLELNAFRLPLGHLQEIRSAFAERIREGLPAAGKEIRALPTFLPLPDEGLGGEAAVLDLGGTNLRAAALDLVPGRAFRFTAGPVGKTLLSCWDSARGFFGLQAELIRELGRPSGLPLGYCFSYPAVVGEDLDAVLVRWTKGLSVPGVAGQAVGRLLRDALSGLGARPGPVVVLNDTVAALLGGFYLAGGGKIYSDAIGLVAGTGTNLASFFPAAELGAKARGRKGRMAVNLESGNFHPPHLTSWDDDLDAGRADAGEQRLEKAVSGIFLPELYAFILRSGRRAEGGRDGSAGRTVAEMARRAMSAPASEDGALARSLLDRSAELLAACLAGLIDVLGPAGRTAIVAEGAVVNRTPGYAERIRRTLARLLGDREDDPGRFALLSFAHVNLVGAARAALVGKEQPAKYSPDSAGAIP